MAFRFVADLIPIYPLYAVMFAERGMSTGEISTLLFVWSAVAFVLEVPTGGLADRFSRRHLLAVAQVLRAIGFTVWWLVPSFTGYLIGFVLWGVESALTSGAFEALVYDELRARRQEHSYARLMGRAGSAGLAAQVLGGLSAAALVTSGFAPLLWASVIAGLLAAAIVLTFPDAPRAAAPSTPTSEGTYLRYLREGLRYAATHAPVRRLLLFSGAVFGIGAVDEFFSLLLSDAGISNARIGIWVAVYCAVAAIGSLAAYRFARASRRSMGALTVLLGGVLLVAVSADGVLVPLGLVAFGGIFCLQDVAMDAQLQAAITSDARATITSVQGLVAELFALSSFLVFGVVGGAVGIQLAAGGLAVALVVAGAIYGRRGPWRRRVP